MAFLLIINNLAFKQKMGCRNNPFFICGQWTFIR